MTKPNVDKLLKGLVLGIFILGLAYLLFNEFQLSKERSQVFKKLDNQIDTLVIPLDTVDKIIANLPSKEENDDDEVNSEKSRDREKTKHTVSKAKFSWENSNNVFIYRSDNYDIEYPDGRVERVDEITYHTFDMDKNLVVQSSQLFNQQFEISYPFRKMRVETGLIGNRKTYVLDVNTIGCKEVWWSPDVPNLGYDYNDGRRIACYDLEIMYKKGNNFN